jgi:hypothetical protein
MLIGRVGSHIRSAFVDAPTTPVTLLVGDNYGAYIVKIKPLP